jgi:5-methylcytosine-specific restriction enzyme A
MPEPAPKPCAYIGCPAITQGHYCDAHRRAESARYDRDRAADHKFYSLAPWRRLRKKKLAANPICECGCGKKATVVHHKIDRQLRPDLALDWDNLESVTKPCHDRETAKRRAKAGIL